jgi:ABC-2 type transport system ATP-binding protein
VDDVSLEVFEGEIFGLIGPNGAGKTTTMECVQGHRHPDHGTISVLGLDPRRDSTALRQRIGVQHQDAHLQKRIKVWEAVDLWSSLYSRVVDTTALLTRLGLEAKRDAWFWRRPAAEAVPLHRAGAGPIEVAFLDELTTGSTRRPAAPSGDSSQTSRIAARPCFSPRIRWRRRSACATAWRSSSTAG